MKTKTFKVVKPLINSNISGGILIPTNPITNIFAQVFSYHKPTDSIAVTKAYIAVAIPLNFNVCGLILIIPYINHSIIVSLPSNT